MFLERLFKWPLFSNWLHLKQMHFFLLVNPWEEKWTKTHFSDEKQVEMFNEQYSEIFLV